MIGGILLFEYFGDVSEAVGDGVFEDDFEVEDATFYGAIRFAHVFDRSQVRVVDGVEVADFQTVFVETVEAESVDRCIVVSIECHDAVVLDYIETLLESLSASADCFDGDVDPFAVGDFLDFSPNVRFVDVQGVVRAESTGGFQLARVRVDGDDFGCLDAPAVSKMQ